ncbi:calnexin-like isoform X1 [Mytilus californianus]|uniref:calnexin-like isoform X1 n=1 Tax=Mytilus californianus TaxID=6549 RepID=UPI002245E13A|nr:calnexin-like isoform X1 [Mytilus californianus]
MMKLKSIFLLFLSLGLLHVSICDTEEEDTDDDTTVEVEEEPVVVEKVNYVPPVVKGNTFFTETFDKPADFEKRWTKSQTKKDGAEETIAKYDGKWSVEEPKESALRGDHGLVLKSKAKHHAISSKLNKPFRFEGKPFVVQYEVKFQNGLECGGAYVKLLSMDKQLELKQFQDKTPYTIMFGPDKCGMDHKLHFIFRHKNPKTGEFEEKHAKKPTANIDSYFTDKKTHLYKLVVNPDNSFEIFVDNTLVNEGSLLEDMSPPVNPPKEIDDPNDKKSDDWDEREKIPDPDAVKPEDWDESEPEYIIDESATKPDGWLEDEPELIPDPDAEKPEDWDEDMDGEWEPPQIDNTKCKDAVGCGKWERPQVKNPKYKGKWRPEMIDNPDYKGIWAPRKITNPDFFEDLEPYKMTPIHALGLELWSMTDEIVFDNFLITDDKAVSSSYTAQTWEIKSAQEKVVSGGKGLWASIRGAADERPWLWAVYVVVLLLPVLLLSICLCPRSGPIKPEVLEAQRKKTDEPSPDDKEAENKEEEVGPKGDNQETVKKTKKSDLDVKEESSQDEEGDDEGEEEEKTEDKSADSTRRTSPRKRKPRKE